MKVTCLPRLALVGYTKMCDSQFSSSAILLNPVKTLLFSSAKSINNITYYYIIGNINFLFVS